MPFISCDDYKARAVQRPIVDEGAKLFLFTNIHTVDGSETLATFTEVTDPAYARQTAVGNTPTVTAHVASQLYVTVNFPAMSTDVTVWGYGLVNPTGNLLIGAGNFDAGPITIPAGQPFPLSFTYKYGAC